MGKKRISRDEIVAGGVSFLREKGKEAWHARALAAWLGISTQPLFSCFSGMDELYEACLSAAAALFREAMKQEVETGKWAEYKAFGMAYIHFAAKEPKLFRLLFMEGGAEDRSVGWEESVRLICSQTGVSEQKAEDFHLKMWIFVHGIATFAAQGRLSLSEEEISKAISDQYRGLCFVMEEKNERN